MCCLAFFVNFKSRHLIILCWIDEFSCENLLEMPVKSYRGQLEHVSLLLLGRVGKCVLSVRRSAPLGARSREARHKTLSSTGRLGTVTHRIVSDLRSSNGALSDPICWNFSFLLISKSFRRLQLAHWLAIIAYALLCNSLCDPPSHIIVLLGELLQSFMKILLANLDCINL
jgi:hypothetical protein